MESKFSYLWLEAEFAQGLLKAQSKLSDGAVGSTKFPSTL